MNITDAVRRIEVASSLSWVATDVARAALGFLHTEDDPDVQVRFDSELTRLLNEIVDFSEEFGILDPLIDFLERRRDKHGKDA
jgi:hypothetical protein